MGYEIDKLPAGAVVETVGHDGYQVLLPDGSRKFVSIIPGDPITVVKTLFPVDTPISIEIGKADEEMRYAGDDDPNTR